MSDKQRHSIAVRLGAGLMRKMNKIVSGYDPVFLNDMLDLLGVRGVGRWGEKLQAVTEQLVARYGDFEAQLIISFAAMFNGCPICSVGHMYCANLHHFDDTGELFTIDEREVYDLQAMNDTELLAVATQRLSAPAFTTTRERIHRLYELKYMGAPPKDEDDQMLLGAVAAWDLLSECTIMSDTADPATIDPLTDVAKRKDLIARYHKARGR